MQDTLTSTKIHSKKKSIPLKIINAVTNVLLVIILLSALAVIFISIQSKAAGVTPSIGGYQILKVISGSMEPSIHTGAVIVIKQADPTQLKVGDIITFKSVDYDNQLVTHRIASINKDNGLSFITRGDANSTDDITPVLIADIKGITLLTIPYMGHLMSFIQSPVGLIILVIVPGFIVIVYELIKIIKSIKQIKKKQASSVSENIE